MPESLRLWNRALGALLQEALTYALKTYRHLDWQGETIHDELGMPDHIVVFTQQRDLYIAIRFDHPVRDPYFAYSIGKSTYEQGRVEFDTALLWANSLVKMYMRDAK